jgi:ribosomal-protein-alanine N-acetyltransferase
VPKLIADVVERGTVAAGMQPTLAVGADLELGPFEDRDVESVVEAFSDPDIQYFHFRQLDHGEALQWIEQSHQAWRDERAATWAIRQRSNGQVLGRVTVYLRLAEGHSEVSYWVLPTARRRHVATRACRAATAWAHSVGIHRVELQHSTKNEGSQRVAIAAGFVFEGIQRSAARLIDGWHDMALYAHLSTDPS